jgi:hypothetical protein
MFVSRGHVPYPLFRAAIDNGDLPRVRALAASMPVVRLGDALRICLLMRDDAPQLDRAAVRWLGRFALEARGATIGDVADAAEALEVLPREPAAAMAVLSELCLRFGLGE